MDDVPADPEKYQKWLRSQRDFFAKWDLLQQDFLTLHPDNMLSSHVPDMSIFHTAFDERLQEDAPPYHLSGLTFSME